METGIIALWTIRRIARQPSSRLGTITVNGKVEPAIHRMLRGCSCPDGAAIPLLVVIGLKTLTDMSSPIRASSSLKGMTVTSGDRSKMT